MDAFNWADFFIEAACWVRGVKLDTQLEVEQLGCLRE
jgi:hypothetical protein